MLGKISKLHTQLANVLHDNKTATFRVILSSRQKSFASPLNKNHLQLINLLKVISLLLRVRALINSKVNKVTI